ncbi:DUF1295 domain-containing protein [Rudaeicoccus suwonensis]|uniref:Steroid 5-alpha reductase family enzyme n=1 Tax=Rudaeicoccus suwonensis TaxID=657409 RepID=A0A561DX07_9MICO|nr:DUF1295 domain-containing protein [Rudaeicoccus suwonensis]TWE07894.1 steroid 5-alpha reductase family enzyme [Rudaeicoccus suwonensis]
MGSVDLARFGLNLVMTAGVLAVVLGLVMSISVKRSDHSFIDIFWGPGFAVVAVCSYLMSIGTGGSQARRLLVLITTCVWALRLGGYLARRNLGKGEDKRYTAFLRHQTGNRYFWLIRNIYGKQGVLMWCISVPVQLAMYESRGLGAIEGIGFVVWLIGFLFESVGDWQLSGFKADPANKGRIMDRGLWAWTRHPNYFGDACVWCAFWLFALGSWWGLLTVFSPVLMAYCLVSLGGKKLTEKGMRRSRGAAFEAYAARTSGFFPRPPRRVDDLTSPSQR